MKYLTTTETAKNWGISPRRVALLASKGRIEGAVSAGSYWIIPENAQKPADSRRKKAKTPEINPERYVFPYLLACIHSAEQIESFTDDERELYRLCLIYEKGEFEYARSLAENLLSSHNHYIRMGALYHLPTICMYLGDYFSTEKYSILFRTAIQNASDHKAELDLLLKAFSSELDSASSVIGALDHSDPWNYPYDILPYLSNLKLFADTVRYGMDGTPLDIHSYEVICRMTESQGFFLNSIFMNLYLSTYYAAADDTENEIRHLRRAVDLGLEHEMHFSLAGILSYNKETADHVLSLYPPEIAEQFKKLGKVYMEGRTGYADYRGKAMVLSVLKEDDYKLISWCLRDCSIDKMSQVFGLSRSGMNRRLSKLYKKLGVKSKNELKSFYLNSILDWGN